MVGRDDQLPHTLVPLVLAVTIVRSKFSHGTALVATEPNAVATFIASTVPIWEYSDNARHLPRPLQNAVRDGIFRGGRELIFLDGRPSKVRLAVHVDDVDCVIRMLKDPERALHIRNQVVRKLSRILIERSRQASARSRSLRSVAARILNNAEALRGVHEAESQPPP